MMSICQSLPGRGKGGRGRWHTSGAAARMDSIQPPYGPPAAAGGRGFGRENDDS